MNVLLISRVEILPYRIESRNRQVLLFHACGWEASGAVYNGACDQDGCGTSDECRDLTVSELGSIHHGPTDDTVPDVPDVGKHVHRRERHGAEYIIVPAQGVGPRKLISV